MGEGVCSVADEDGMPLVVAVGVSRSHPECPDVQDVDGQVGDAGSGTDTNRPCPYRR